MQNFKKFFGLTSTIGLALVALVGCGGASETTSTEGSQTTSQAPAPVTVKMSIMNSVNENPGWLAMIEAANEVLKEQGDAITIEPEIIKTDSWDQYYTKITSNILGRIGGTIGRIAESHVPMMVDKKQVQDLTSLVEELKETGEFNEGVFEGVAKSDGKYYGLPSGTQHMVLYYNKTIFDQYNTAHPNDQLNYPSSDWNNASTFEEIRTMAKKLTTGTGSEKRFGISAGPFLAYAGMYSKNSGGVNIFDEQGNCCIDSEPFYQVYDWFEDMLITDKSMPSTSDTAVLDSMARFLGGNIAMIIDGVWQVHDVCKYTEDYEIGVAAIPVLERGNKSYTTTFADRFWAARNSSHPEADQKALKALMSVQAIDALAKSGVGGMPIRKASLETYMDNLSTTKLAESAETIKEGVANKVNVPYSTYYNQVDQHINQKMSIWINGQMSTVEFVKFMDETMKKGMEGKL